MPDIEVTDEMIEAGAAALLDWTLANENLIAGAAAIYRAMRAKERESEADNLRTPYEVVGHTPDGVAIFKPASEGGRRMDCDAREVFTRKDIANMTPDERLQIGDERVYLHNTGLFGR